MRSGSELRSFNNNDGKYQNAGLIGRGTIGFVYKALHKANGKLLAVKSIYLADSLSIDARIGVLVELETALTRLWKLRH